MWTLLDTPIGELRIVADETAIVAIEFDDTPVVEPQAPQSEPASARRARQRSAQRDPGQRADSDPLLILAKRQLTEYFAGTRTIFDLPLAPVGSDFQRQVWNQLQQIGYGSTASYGQLAAALGKTAAASRAVGTANGANPIPIVIPCHRVIGASGRLTGYAGGLDRKRALLQLEGVAIYDL